MLDVLPHQIVWIWIGISGLTGAFMALLISEGRNPLYILGNIFFCGFFGALFGGFFVALTDALVWEFWSLLLPVFIGGIVSYLVAVFLRDKIPKPRIEVKPIAFVISLIMIIVLSISAVYPLATSQATIETTQVKLPTAFLNDAKLIRPSGDGGFSVVSLSDEFDRISLDINQLIENPFTAYRIRSYYASVDFPFRVSETPTEGQYISFKLTFSVSSASPTDWQKPVINCFVWGDVNGNGQYDDGTDKVLSARYYKLPTSTDGVYVSAPCVYWASNGTALWAMYSYPAVGGDIGLLPVIFGKCGVGGSITPWKDDSKYTFSNTPEGFKPPYDQFSIALLDNGTLVPMEDVYSWYKIPKGGSCNVYGKLYCPEGMSSVAKDWYFVVVAYDDAYGVMPLAYHEMHFQVNPKGEEQLPPIININSAWWIETALFLLVGVACLAIIKYGGKWAFR